MPHRIVNPDSLPRPRGFAHGIVAPPGASILFVAGQTAADEHGAIAAREFVAQFDTALGRVLEVVKTAGGAVDDIVAMRVFTTDMDGYRMVRVPLGETWRLRMGRHYPAMTLVEVSGLVDPEATVEIEAVAVIAARAERS
jgi:enamine deaminase RidA (YjgF/YER057c/UK114 family)